MTKAILIVRFPYKEELDYTRYLDFLSNHSVTDEYHVLVTKESNLDRVEFETHNVLNSTDVNIEELKQQLLEQFNK